MHGASEYQQRWSFIQKLKNPMDMIKSLVNTSKKTQLAQAPLRNTRIPVDELQSAKSGNHGTLNVFMTVRPQKRPFSHHPPSRQGLESFDTHNPWRLHIFTENNKIERC